MERPWFYHGSADEMVETLALSTEELFDATRWLLDWASTETTPPPTWMRMHAEAALAAATGATVRSAV